MDFAQLARSEHNFARAGLSPEPPTTLKAAEVRFSSFLRSQNYPENICWLIPGDVVVDHQRQY
jgi:hypothetical protein